MKKNKKNSLQVNEYKIQFIYNNNPDNIHTRYFQSISLIQVKENLNKIINGHKDWELVTIEMFNRYTQEFEEANEEK